MNTFIDYILQWKEMDRQKTQCTWDMIIWNRLLLGRLDCLHDCPMGILSLLVLYLVGINRATFAMFAWDKYSAINGEWRIPEKTLLLVALFVGTPGAIAAQQRLRHKTRKQPFRAQLILIASLHVLLLVALAIVQRSIDISNDEDLNGLLALCALLIEQ